MVSAFFTLALQLSVSQRYTGPALNLVRMGLVANLIAAAVVTAAQGLAGLLIGMAFMGAGLGLLGPAIAAGASLAVSRDEQGGAAGLITACPAAGFVIGPILGGALYQMVNLPTTLRGHHHDIGVELCDEIASNLWPRKTSPGARWRRVCPLEWAYDRLASRSTNAVKLLSHCSVPRLQRIHQFPKSQTFHPYD